MKRGNSEKEKRVSDKKLLVLSLGLITIIVLGFLVYKTFFQTPEIKFSLKAAIIDQLGKHFPNPEFNETVTNLLRDAGFNVSYYGYKTVTVDFYRELVKRDYGIIILRAHSALRANETIVDLFTSEEYDPDPNKYEDMRGKGLLTKGEYLFEQESGQFYFAITPKFIENYGYFPKSVIIAMGCWSLKPECEEMANAFISRGAEAYVGWTEIVLHEDTDQETVRLLEMLLKENKPLTDAVDKTDYYTYHGDGKTIISRMKFYPQSAGDLRISELIAEAKASSTTTTATFNDLGGSLFFLIARHPRLLNRRIFS
jgi:hypothetical protein